MKNYAKTLLLAAVLSALVVPATAEKGVSASKTAAHKQTANAKKTAAKHASHAKTSKVAAGEASSLAKETGSGERQGMREENRGRVTSAKRTTSHPNHVAKAGKNSKSSTVASRRKVATLQNASQSHAKASLKTSQLTAARASRTKTKNVSTQHEVPGKGKKAGAKKPVVDPVQNQAPKPADQPALKSNNARMF